MTLITPYSKVEIWQSLGYHEHIVQLKAIMNDKEHCYLVQELCCGDLFDLIAASRGLPEIKARVYFRQLMSAVEWCHSKVDLLLFAIIDNFGVCSATGIKNVCNGHAHADTK